MDKKEWKDRVHYSRKETLSMYMKGRRRRVFTVQS